MGLLRRIALLVVGLVGIVAGSLLLLAPYDHVATIPDGRGEVVVRCKPPLIDVTTPDNVDDDWFLIAPPEGVTFDAPLSRSELLTGGSICSPDGGRRTAAGAAAALLGAALVLVWVARRPRRPRAAEGHGAGDGPSGADGADPPTDAGPPGGEVSSPG
ncbi:MAG: hypothetical protein R2702_17625 [Acidimicrobiales bacterium]